MKFPTAQESQQLAREFSLNQQLCTELSQAITTAACRGETSVQIDLSSKKEMNLAERILNAFGYNTSYRGIATFITDDSPVYTHYKLQVDWK